MSAHLLFMPAVELALPLAEVLVKATFVLAVAAILCRLLVRQSAALRHRLWLLATASCLLLPWLVFLVPQYAVSIFPESRAVAGRPTWDPVAAQVLVAPTGPGDATGSAGAQQNSVPASSSEALTNETGSQSGRFGGLRLPGALLTGLADFLILLWFSGTLLGAILLVASLVRQGKQLRTLPEIRDPRWTSAVQSAARELGVRRPIRSLVTDQPCIPTVVGVVRPCLVVPSDWPTWTDSQRRCILLHELAHIRRHDVAAQLLGRLAVLTYWFHPLVWHAVRRLRVERELASDDCVLQAGQAASEYAAQLLRTFRCYRHLPVRVGVAMTHTARLDQRVRAILNPGQRRQPVGARQAVWLSALVAVSCTTLAVVTLSVSGTKASPPSHLLDEPAVAGGMWREAYTIEFPGTLPVSVAFSSDGELLLTGDTSGEVMALVFPGDDAQWRWKANVQGNHAAVAFSADKERVYATTADGVRMLDLATGKEVNRLEEAGVRPTAIGVFPDNKLGEDLVQSKIVFGNPRGYFVKTWFQGKLPESVGTLQTVTTSPDGAEPADGTAVPMAVDPEGRSAIMTGPIDPTGDLSGEPGKNVLWAYVCGNYEPGSPGNRVLVGHQAAVASAAWARDGNVAVTGDASGRIILWNATTMKESSRLELGGRILALALSDDGTRRAAWVAKAEACDLYLWQADDDTADLKPTYTEQADFEGQGSHASLSFTSDGSQLAGCAIHTKWLSRTGELIGKVHVWNSAPNRPISRIPGTRTLGLCRPTTGPITHRFHNTRRPVSSS